MADVIERVALLPCPFCGGENVETFGPYGWYRLWGISHSCGTFYSGSSEMAQGFKTEAAAIEAWNTRIAAKAALEAAGVERLVEALDWALSKIPAPTRRLERQNAEYYDGYQHARAALLAHRGDGK